MAVLKAGTRLRSAVCDTEIMVIRAAAGEQDLRCGGEPMTSPTVARDPSRAIAASAGGGTLVGKRYVDAADSLELLCTKTGAGTLSLGDVALTVRQAKALPSSD